MTKKKSKLLIRNEDFEEIHISKYRTHRRTWYRAPKIKKDWECPICKEIMRKPVKLNGISAHTFCKDCIKIWLTNRKKNPLTGEKIKGTFTLIENKKISKEIAELFVDCNKAKK